MLYLISVQDTEETEDLSAAIQSMREAAALERMAKENAMMDYAEMHRTGFQQLEKPQFVLTSKNNKYSLAVGGMVALRAGYDFNGISDNIDFVPYDIPNDILNYMPGYDESNAKQKLMMDVSTSRIFVKSIANTRGLGRIQLFMDMDFRGGSEGSYTPRLRSAYVSFLGFTFGRDITTFCDLQAGPSTVDFRGPNSYNFNFATMIRYEKRFARNHFTVGIAAEMPSVNTINDLMGYKQLQRVPDVPAYVQFAWGKNRDSHIRASGVLRTMYFHDKYKDKGISLFGWGAQVSGRIRIARPVVLFMSGVYGEGITPYIQDLTGSNLDLAYEGLDRDKVRAVPMWGWQAAVQVNPVGRLFICGGYSDVRVEHERSNEVLGLYKRGEYMFGNVSYMLTPSCKIAGEFLYGTRKNTIGIKNHANRVNLMVQYNF